MNEQKRMESVLGTDWVVLESLKDPNICIYHEAVAGDVSPAYQGIPVRTVCGLAFTSITTVAVAERMPPPEVTDSDFYVERVFKQTWCIDCGRPPFGSKPAAWINGQGYAP